MTALIRMGQSNGKLTVSENVADLMVLLGAWLLSKMMIFQLETSYHFATIWRMKARDEYMQMLASIDVHAPGKLRTNVH